MTQKLQEWDFLKEGEDETIRKEAENILSSYSQVYDVLAESLQNAVDAVDERYHQDSTTAVTKIMIMFDVPQRRITIIDTGPGMPWDKLKNAPTPNVTYKQQSYAQQPRYKRSRGEKGVGLSFLTFCCNKLRIKTCDGEATLEVEVSNAHDWVQGLISERPMLLPITDMPEGVSKELGSDKYTLVEMTDIRTLDYCDEDIFDMPLPKLRWTLRTKTAVGHTDSVIFDRVPEPNIEITLHFINKDGEEQTGQLPYSYLSPEEYLSAGSKITYESFLELQKRDKLHTAQGKALVYRNSKTTSGGRQISCYAFAMAPRAFADLTQDLELEEGWAPNEWAGIFVATRGMPTGIQVEPPKTYSAGYWRRIFMLLQDDEMNFDVGRKTLRGRAKPMIRDIAEGLWDDTVPYLQSLTPADSESVTRQKQGKLLQLFQQAQKWDNLDFNPVQFLKKPQREQMVVALFYELVGAGVLKGYKTLRNNTFDQYDAFIQYSIDKSEIGGIEALGIKGKQVDDLIIIEFKHNADSVLKDILDNKKSYQDINLLVCWELDKSKFEEKHIDVEHIPPESVYYFGSTHWLYFPGIYQAGDRIAVIELKSFIEKVRGQS